MCGRRDGVPPILARRFCERAAIHVAGCCGGYAARVGAVIISSNRAQSGGGVALSNMATLIVWPTNGLSMEVVANTADYGGGGMLLFGSGTTVDALALHVRHNRANGPRPGMYGGGGLWLASAARGRLGNVGMEGTFSSNWAGGLLATAGAEVDMSSDFSAAPGASIAPPTGVVGNHAVGEVGGVYAYFGSQVTVSDAQIISNMSEDVVGGFGALAATGRLVNVIVAHNRAASLVDGVGFQSSPMALLRHCTIVDNHSIGYW